MGLSFSVFDGGGSANLNDFTIDVGTSGNNTYTLDRKYDAGSYDISFLNNDTTYDIYAISATGSLIGYTNTSKINVSEDFETVVVLGVANSNQIFFKYNGVLNAPTQAGEITTAGAYVTSIVTSSLPNIDDTTVVNGGNFAADVEVDFIGQDLNELNAKSVVRTSSTELLVTRPDSFAIANSPYSVKVVNPNVQIPSGSNAHILSNAVTAGTLPAWTTGSSVFYNLTQPTSITLLATDTETSDIDYSIVSGTLPAGLTLDQESGSITGTFSGSASEGASTAITFRATDAGGNYTDKSISLIANASPVWNTASGALSSATLNGAYSVQLSASSGTAGGSLTYTLQSGSLPSGLSISSSGLISGTATSVETANFTVRVTDEINAFTDRSFSISVVNQVSVEYLVIAGGGGGGNGHGGGGGAGGYRSSVSGENSGRLSVAESALTVLGGTNYVVTVGAGGAGMSVSNASNAPNGSNSVFATVTSLGGGGGSKYGVVGSDGGSGGGSSGGAGGRGGYGTAGQGFDGRKGSTDGFSWGAGGGGGGAGGEGTDGYGVSTSNGVGGNGGVGLASSITGTSIFRAGGGGGGSATGGDPGNGGGGHGGNAGGLSAGVANTGGGGGGVDSGTSTSGGSGVVILRYPNSSADLVVGSGLVIDNGTGGNISGNGTRIAPSFTPSGYKVYMFKSGTGNVSW